MILYYAIGGGLGHLTRARAVLHTLGIKDRVALLTSSSFADDPRVVGGFEVIRVPATFESDVAAYKDWLHDLIDEFSPAEIYLDTFPCGILGEFCDFRFPRSTVIKCVARLLRWDQYEQNIRGASPDLDTCYTLEPLTEEHRQYLRNHTRTFACLNLEDPPRKTSACLGMVLEKIKRRLTWCVMHSGPEREIMELLSYTRQLSVAENVEPEILLVSPRAVRATQGGIEHLDLYPADVLFSSVDRVITACGFNAMRQTESIRNRHRFVPFPRRFDDQFLRASWRRQSCGHPELGESAR
jgi:hypothetical protein